VNAKAQSLMDPALGARRTTAVIARVNALENVADLRDLIALLRS
jgi:hypothetical protein